MSGDPLAIPRRTAKNPREKKPDVAHGGFGADGEELFLAPKVLSGPRFARFVTALPRPAGLAAWLQGLRPSCLPPISWSASFQPSPRARTWFSGKCVPERQRHSGVHHRTGVWSVRHPMRRATLATRCFDVLRVWCECAVVSVHNPGVLPLGLIG